MYKGLLAFSSILITQIPAIAKTFSLYSKRHPYGDHQGTVGSDPSSGLFKGSGIRAIQVTSMETISYGGRVPSCRLLSYVLTLRLLPHFEILEVSGKQDRSNWCFHALWFSCRCLYDKNVIK